MGDQTQTLDVGLDLTDDCSATQLQLQRTGENQIGVSYMQSVTPWLTLGGQGICTLEKSQLDTSLGVMFDRGENLIAAQWDKEVIFCPK
jgi:hypothetical protein